MGALAEAVAAINREMVGWRTGNESVGSLPVCKGPPHQSRHSPAHPFSVSVGLPGVTVSVEWEHLQ